MFSDRPNYLITKTSKNSISNILKIKKPSGKNRKVFNFYSKIFILQLQTSPGFLADLRSYQAILQYGKKVIVTEL